MLLLTYFISFLIYFETTLHLSLPFFQRDVKVEATTTNKISDTANDGINQDLLRSLGLVFTFSAKANRSDVNDLLSNIMEELKHYLTQSKMNADDTRMLVDKIHTIMNGQDMFECFKKKVEDPKEDEEEESDEDEDEKEDNGCDDDADDCDESHRLKKRSSGSKNKDNQEDDDEEENEGESKSEEEEEEKEEKIIKKKKTSPKRKAHKMSSKHQNRKHTKTNKKVVVPDDNEDEDGDKDESE